MFRAFQERSRLGFGLLFFSLMHEGGVRRVRIPISVAGAEIFSTTVQQ